MRRASALRPILSRIDHLLQAAARARVFITITSAPRTLTGDVRGLPADTPAWLAIGSRRVPLPYGDIRPFHLGAKPGVKLVRVIVGTAITTRHANTPAMRLIEVPDNPKAAATPANARATSPRPPRVSVIVPCYNHAAFLPARLASIYGQTRPPDEILLLDDASSDNSADLLAEAAASDPVPGRTRLIVNPHNSGSPFAQWARGLAETTGDLVWIAESDDSCVSDFLAKMLPAFDDPAVSLAQGDVRFVDAADRPVAQGMRKLFRSVGARFPSRRDSVAAHRLVGCGLGERNLLPNASAILFRRPSADDGCPPLNDPQWRAMRVCGDWIFYLHRIRGGKIAFVPEAISRYRIHDSNTSVTSRSEERHVREHAMVAVELAGTHRITGELIERQLARLKTRLARDETTQDIDPGAIYRNAGWQTRIDLRQPNVLVAIHALVPGGAEGFAIRLAIALRRLGCAVTLVELGAHPPDPAVSALVPPDLPLIRKAGENPRDLTRLLRDFGTEWISTHHPRCDLAFARAREALPDDERPRLFCTHHGYYHLDAANLVAHRRLFSRQVSRWINVAAKGRLPFELCGLLSADTTSRFLDLPAAIFSPATPVSPVRFPNLGQPFVVTVASRALPEKGWRAAISAIDLARAQTNVDIRLVLAGAGPVHDELQTESLPHFVRLAGFQTDVPALYAEGHLGLLATTYAGESCPLGVVECLAVGRPVVVTAVGETPNMLRASDDGLAGDLVEGAPVSDYVSRLATAIGRLATEPEIYAAAARRAPECARRYDMAEVARDYLAAWRAAGPNEKCV